MAEQGHRNHWECVEEIITVLQKVLPSTLQGGTKIETSEVIANCFENETPGTTKVFSVSDESEITPKILLATNPKKQVNEVGFRLSVCSIKE